MSYSSTTNILEHLELQIQDLSRMKQELVANQKTTLLASYTAVIDAITADRVVVNASTNPDTLQS